MVYKEICICMDSGSRYSADIPKCLYHVAQITAFPANFHYYLFISLKIRPLSFFFIENSKQRFVSQPLFAYPSQFGFFFWYFVLLIMYNF